ncbi:hypothetical protein CCHL11_09253 [Colletotrichum chlorophyti]|uniref:Hemerythrin-like domain-containing protein n=1 Tax=Colletotrichum chlorophyti TaxID=708187 RepID=A0A1Q8RC58_9PEZI|nr:hypothetical protein CCHL11_09253 [Colletotrichum chlorophyti]
MSETASSPMTASEHEIYNRFAVMMENFHGHFRRTWKRLQKASIPTVDAPSSVTPDQIVREGLFFCYRLTNHHNIEEKMFFPLLARKMPQFRGDDAVLLQQHRQIHQGLEGLQEYLENCRSRRSTFDHAVLKSKMDSWGDVLLLHLDQEVEMLGAEHMRKYWTLEEIMEMPL